MDKYHILRYDNENKIDIVFNFILNELSRVG